ncbi:MAG: zinc-ribbon domain-containing protein [Pyrinomonadaceae bacterium]
MKEVGSKATPEVIATWVEVHRMFQQCTGERRERLQQVADLLGVSYKVARRRLRNYEAMHKAKASDSREENHRRGEERPERAAAGADGEAQLNTCVDCGRDFVFSAGEQAYYRERGFTPPKRCRDCREARKAERGEREPGKPSESSMKGSLIARPVE